MKYDVIVVGSGLSGLYGALLAARHGNVLVLTKANLEDSNTYHAQGGIAVALASADSPELHYHDTIVAGAGLCDPRAVRVLVEEGPRRVRDLIRRGVPFDRVDGEIAFTREAAHSQPRVVHAGGDATGKSIEETIADQVRSSPRITVRQNVLAAELVQNRDRVTGVRALDCATGACETFLAPAVVLATGGAGRLFSHTTNPEVATGGGIALAFRAGAELADLEFVQFHPTALAVPGAPRFLISEAVRGEGGILRNAAGQRFMTEVDPRAELAPRDVVARAIAFESQRTGHDHVYLDVTHLAAEQVSRRFPTISGVCHQYGIDLAKDWIPVAPAAHYLMGGIRTNAWGETSLPGLYACGECACTGVHGANRLASNSLLETLVFSGRVVQAIFEGAATDGVALNGSAEEAIEAEEPLLADRRVAVAPPTRREAPPRSLAGLRDLTWSLAGLTRDANGLQTIEGIASTWQAEDDMPRTRDEYEVASLTLLARLIAIAALHREESRGAHFRTDYRHPDPDWRRHIVVVDGVHSTGDTSESIRASTGRG
ncbi:MAG: L-aspartate oxidase [Chloroflexota bacterium]